MIFANGLKIEILQFLYKVVDKKLVIQYNKDKEKKRGKKKWTEESATKLY